MVQKRKEFEFRLGNGKSDVARKSKEIDERLKAAYLGI